MERSCALGVQKEQEEMGDLGASGFEIQVKLSMGIESKQTFTVEIWNLAELADNPFRSLSVILFIVSYCEHNSSIMVCDWRDTKQKRKKLISVNCLMTVIYTEEIIVSRKKAK